MINVNEVYTTVQDLANKEQKGFIQPSRFNRLASQAVSHIFNRKFKGYQSTQEISDDLRPFIKLLELDVAVDGYVNYPEDYVNLSSIRYVKVTQSDGQVVKSPIEIEPKDDNELGYILNSRIVMPTKDFPVAFFYDNGIRVFPNDLQRVELTYLRQPTTPLWAFTTVNNRPVYNADDSVDFEFGYSMFSEVVVEILSYIGVTLREAEVTQYAQVKSQES